MAFSMFASFYFSILLQSHNIIFPSEFANIQTIKASTTNQVRANLDGAYFQFPCVWQICLHILNANPGLASLIL